MHFYFEVPANVAVIKIIENLSEEYEFRQVSKQYTLKTYYDSFDWRLWRHDLICEFSRSNASSALSLVNRKTNALVASTVLFDLPAFASQFNLGKVRHTLEPILEMRALISIGTIESDISHFDLLDDNEHVLAKMVIEEFESLNACITVFPVKGHEKLAKNLTAKLIAVFGLVDKNKPVLLDVLRLQGRQPKDYSESLTIPLIPDMCPVKAYKTVFNKLSQVIQLNEQGVLADTDSEFLHDFRVAVRKTRACLNQSQYILPDEVITAQKEFFAWLGQITGETRDLDVYLLDFENYKKQIPKNIRQSLNPLQHFLSTKKQKAHKTLAQKLRSPKYKSGIKAWNQYLSTNTINPMEDKPADYSVKKVVDEKIWKLYKQALKQGEAIDRQSPPEALHKLRKTCKKLRYMLEFFQSLYAEEKVKRLLKRLKQLQTVLGNYQDYAVQQERLQQFSEEMQMVNTPSRTFLAMGILIQNLEVRKRKARNRFSMTFDKFNKSETQAKLKELFR